MKDSFEREMKVLSGTLLQDVEFVALAFLDKNIELISHEKAYVAVTPIIVKWLSHTNLVVEQIKNEWLNLSFEEKRNLVVDYYQKGKLGFRTTKELIKECGSGSE
ncbi:hypothetical protein [Phascolarctobacterium sp.]|uniref:hypothetical protein n=1 Tax=Phascolarctobacterium sp. TaxID=2049039 RepID=UPI00386A50CE